MKSIKSTHQQSLPTNIYLSGFMAAGKTTIGTALAKQLNRRFVDTDALIEKSAGKSINAIFKSEGESGFRKRESNVLRELSLKKNLVVSLGGGAVLSLANRRLLQKGQWVHLETSWSLIAQRIQRNNKRPLAKSGLASVYALFCSRQRYYSLAPKRVHCQNLVPQAIADFITRMVQ